MEEQSGGFSWEDAGRVALTVGKCVVLAGIWLVASKMAAQQAVEAGSEILTMIVGDGVPAKA